MQNIDISFSTAQNSTILKGHSNEVTWRKCNNFYWRHQRISRVSLGSEMHLQVFVSMQMLSLGNFLFVFLTALSLHFLGFVSVYFFSLYF